MKELLQDVMKKSIDAQEVAGISLLVVKEGKELCFLAEGMADKEREIKMSRDTIVHLYSQTKPVCAAAAMILVERGLLDLYEPASKFLDGFKHQTVWENGENRPVKREVTVKDLLQMTSGTCYPDYPGECGRLTAQVYEEVDRRLYTDDPMTAIEFANAIGKCPLAFEPGSSWNYGTSADILGAIIEVISGVSLGEFMDREIFTPLGMKDTAFWVPEEKQERLCKVYETIIENNKNKLIPYEGNNLGIQNRFLRKPAYEAGGAGLASTLDDYLRFASMLLNGGEFNGVRILSKTSVEYLTNGQLLDRQQIAFEDTFGYPGYTYGNLMRVCNEPSKASMYVRKGEYGWDGWLGTMFFNFPEEKMTILMFMQNCPETPGPISKKLKNIILSHIE